MQRPEPSSLVRFAFSIWLMIERAHCRLIPPSGSRNESFMVYTICFLFSCRSVTGTTSYSSRFGLISSSRCIDKILSTSLISPFIRLIHGQLYFGLYHSQHEKPIFHARSRLLQVATLVTPHDTAKSKGYQLSLVVCCSQAFYTKQAWRNSVSVILLLSL